MKKLCNTSLLLFALFMLFSVCMYGQKIETDSALPTINVWTLLISLIIPGIVGQLAVLFTDAAKWMNTGQWSWSIFITTKIKPFVVVQLIAIVIVIAITYVPSVATLLKTYVGYDLTTLTTATLYATATAIFDGLFKKK